MAKRYGCLPTTILEQATTLDMFVASVAVGFENYQHRDVSTDKPKVPELTQQQMLDMIAKVKEQKNVKS